jgi:hypothetical protein
MYQVISHPVENSLSIVDKLKLARSLAAAVLKFHSTPWLGQYFALTDLSLFQIGPDLSACLQTLHFDIDFVRKHCLGLDSSSMEGFELKNASTIELEAIEDAKLQYGIRNLTLWSLGTVLLQIGRWDTIDSLGMC